VSASGRCSIICDASLQAALLLKLGALEDEGGTIEFVLYDGGGLHHRVVALELDGERLQVLWAAKGVLAGSELFL